MKTNFLKLACMLAIAGGITGCSSDDSKSEVLPVECPDGFTGTDCSTKKRPTKIYITGIDIVSYPMINGEGNAWDWIEMGENENPDVYFSIYSGGQYIYTADSYYENADGETLSFQTPLYTENINLAILVELRDYDEATNEYEYMSSTLPFFIYDPQQTYFPQSVLAQNGNTTVRINLKYEW